MKKTSLAAAKARFSALVDEAEHKGRQFLILRHGKPSAAIVPVSVVTARARARKKKRRRLARADVKLLFDRLGKSGSSRSAVADLRRSRR